MDAVLGEVTIRQRRKKLQEIEGGKDVSDAYTAALTHLKAQKGKRVGLALRALMWVCYSERPLRAKELCDALGVEIGSTDLDPENVPAIRTLLSCCLGLLKLEASSSTVRLVHFTLKEHLSSDPLFHSPHSTIAEVCLTYLNFGSVRDLSPTLRSAPSAMPLLQYASVYWGEHTKREITENVKILALRLLDRFVEHISAQLLLLRYEKDTYTGYDFDQVRGPAGFTGLHGVAYFGIAELVGAVLDMKEWDANALDRTGRTALTWAAYKGHEQVVKVLLKLEDVKPNCVDIKCGLEPLSWVARSGHEGVAKILLQRKDVNPDQAGTSDGRTPLILAVQGGHEGIVKMLLEREDVNPDRADTESGMTPLSWAAMCGHEWVVKILLERRDVNPNQTDTQYGWTPLMRAAKHERWGVGKILLERKDVHPNQADTEYGPAPISSAAKAGHEGIVKMLLERKDVNPDPTDYNGATPLRLAAGGGHEGVVKMLLEREDVNPNLAEKYGRTPLFMAAERGYEGVLKILLERKDVNPKQGDKYGRTALSLARWRLRLGMQG